MVGVWFQIKSKGTWGNEPDPDMLRYDGVVECVRAVDCAKGEVIFNCTGRTCTPARWNSFGWVVIKQHNIKGDYRCP